MARDNETNTLELHIKVNGQNLSAISEKCNVGTLRIPSDPSWPKIPLRRSSNSTDDIIVPPCVVTVTGTSRKGRSIAQTAVTCQHQTDVEPRLSNQKYRAIMHIREPRKLPICFDPRFRRQISRQKAEKPDESCSTKSDKETAELDTYIPQETKKLEDKSWKTGENVDGDQTPPYRHVDNLLESVTKSAKETADYPIKEASRPLLLMFDEKKIHALPINTLNVEAASSSAQSLQCYSVQIPVVAYHHNVPLQLPNMPGAVEEDIEVARGNDSVKDGQVSVGSTCGNASNARSTLTNSAWVYSPRESGNEGRPLDSIEQCNAKSNDDVSVSEKKSILKHCDGHNVDGQMRDKETIDSNVSLNRNIINEIALSKDRHGNVDAIDNAGNIANNGKSYSNLDTAARLKSLVGQRCKTDSCTADGCNERKTSSERKIARTWIHSCVNARKQRFPSRVKNDRNGNNADKPSTNVISAEMLEKSIQSLAFGEVRDKEYSEGNKEKESKKEKRAELRVNAKRKMAPMNLSEKAKSFFRKKSRLAITDSDCTLILPGPRGIKGKRYEKTCGRPKVSQLLRGRNGIKSTNSILVKSNASKHSRINSRSLTNLRAGNSLEKPSSIPLETRELLNKSYWEYYWRLRCKIASAMPNKAEKHDKCSNKPQDYLPESQTLQQCPVLSCMINTALRDSTTADGRLPSNPAVSVTSANPRDNVCDASGLSSMLVKKIKRKKMKRASKRLLGLETIALLCITMYVAVIFLPMMYDWFFDEDDNDENASYMELTFQYVVSSFGEALDGIVEVLTTIFLRPVRFDRKQ